MFGPTNRGTEKSFSISVQTSEVELDVEGRGFFVPVGGHFFVASYHWYSASAQFPTNLQQDHFLDKRKFVQINYQYLNPICDGVENTCLGQGVILYQRETLKNHIFRRAYWNRESHKIWECLRVLLFINGRRDIEHPPQIGSTLKESGGEIWYFQTCVDTWELGIITCYRIINDFNLLNILDLACYSNVAWVLGVLTHRQQVFCLLIFNLVFGAYFVGLMTDVWFGVWFPLLLLRFYRTYCISSFLMNSIVAILYVVRTNI